MKLLTFDNSTAKKPRSGLSSCLVNRKSSYTFHLRPHNQEFLQNVSSFLHHKSCHSSRAVSKRYKGAYDRFMKSHSPRSLSFRFAINHTTNTFI